MKKEIWAYGLRNVWRFSFDRFNGDMFLGDVGQNSWEEINYIKKIVNQELILDGMKWKHLAAIKKIVIV